MQLWCEGNMSLDRNGTPRYEKYTRSASCLVGSFRLARAAADTSVSILRTSLPSSTLCAFIGGGRDSSDAYRRTHWIEWSPFRLVPHPFRQRNIVYHETSFSYDESTQHHAPRMLDIVRIAYYRRPGICQMSPRCESLLPVE